MECVVLSIAIAMTLSSDTPRDVVFEECDGVKIASFKSNKQRVEVLDYQDGIYYVKEVKK